MSKTVVAWFCAAALFAGCAVAWWVHRDPVIPTIEASHTDRLAEGIKETLETVTARIVSQDEKVRTEVRVVYEQVRTKINALPPDAVCAGLNTELALYRESGLALGTGGLDGD